MFQTHKTLYLILAVIAAIGVAVGLLFAIQNFKTDEEINATSSEARKGRPVLYRSDTTGVGDEGELKGWQIYRNEKYGFEFKYPLEIKITHGGRDFYYEETFGIIGESKFMSGIEAGIATESSIREWDRRCEGVDVDQYCEIFSTLLCEQNGVSSCNELRYGPGGRYIRAVEKNPLNTVRVEFFLYLEKVQSDQIKDLRGLTNNGELSDAEAYSSKILDQILSTFKFIEHK